MYTINIVIKNTAIPISLERKEAEEADKTYQEILSAMKTDSLQVLELTCDKQEGKKVAIVNTGIAAVVMSQNSGANANRPAGFFAAAGLE